MKKILRTVGALILLTAFVVNAFAASGTSFVVNNATINGNVSYKDTSDWNPLTHDSVTANTKSSSYMDSLTARATIYFYNGDTLKTVTKSENNEGVKSVSITVKASGIDVGYKGEGYHYASHENHSGSRTTGVIW